MRHISKSNGYNQYCIFSVQSHLFVFNRWDTENIALIITSHLQMNQISELRNAYAVDVLSLGNNK